LGVAVVLENDFTEAPDPELNKRLKLQASHSKLALQIAEVEFQKHYDDATRNMTEQERVAFQRGIEMATQMQSHLHQYLADDWKNVKMEFPQYFSEGEV
jgi:hypothetical protein